ncbi:DMT family transporter [Sinimarinibacterium sp. NLF-5-8]|uniref:DMT family transporter n=1 Tax=Sinimarinibacterium sp. NLF-5-8 TaxID=2698684 RepID=UPI00137BC7F0|nr:EamA family transporter [Sinimarinibacterium sp. NLF-5-8]QHS09902.1 EamA family transporter [Sinimarinibacterium sp. NLF-5-8]
MEYDLRRGALHALASTAAFSIMGACIKVAAATTPNELVVFTRCVVGLLILLPILLRRGGAGIRTQRLGGHLIRAGFGIASMYAFFYAIGNLPLAEAMLLTYSTPLWIPFIAWFWIGEKPPMVVFPAAILGIVGIALIVKPGMHPINTFAAIIGAMSGFFAAGSMVSIRRMTDTEPPARIVFYFALMGTSISAIPLLWAWQTPSLIAVTALLGAGISATLGQIQMTRAYALAPAALVGPFAYVTVILSAGLAWLFWDESLDRWSMLGTLLVVSTCVLVSWPQKRALAAAPQSDKRSA